jgi:hypothetical protein
MSASRVIPQQRNAPAELVSLGERDISDIAGFIASQSGQPIETVEPHLRWFLLENPERQSQQPMGFGLRSAAQLVGCILCSPQAFHFNDDKIVLMGSSSFYVDDHHRGHGGRIFLQYCRLAKQWPLFGTSANAEAAALWKAAGASPIPGSDGELFGVLRWPPFVEELAHRRNPNRILSRLAAGPMSNLVSLVRPLKLKLKIKIKSDPVAADSLRPLNSAEQVNGLSLNAPSGRLTAMRDLPYIHWRYFSGRDQTAAVFAFRGRHPDREILVTVNQRTRGYRGQIRALNVLDVYPEVSPDDWLRIVAALSDRYEKIVDAIVLRSLDADRQKLFCARGFQRRTFDAPIGWFLDKAKILPTSDWYPVPADGDGLI